MHLQLFSLQLQESKSWCNHNFDELSPIFCVSSSPAAALPSTTATTAWEPFLRLNARNVHYTRSLVMTKMTSCHLKSKNLDLKSSKREPKSFKNYVPTFGINKPTFVESELWEISDCRVLLQTRNLTLIVTGAELRFLDHQDHQWLQRPPESSREGLGEDH